MNPALIWTADLCDGERFWRQVSVSDLVEGGKRSVKVILLGSEGGFDHVAIHEISITDASGDKYERVERFFVRMPGANGRLIAGYIHPTPFWQDINGEIFEGRVTLQLVSPFF